MLYYRVVRSAMVKMQRFILILLCTICIETAFAAPSIQDLVTLIDQNQFAKAAQAGEQLLASNPGHAKIQFLTAYAYQMTQKNKKASHHYLELIQRHPDLPEPRNNLAMIYLANGDYDRASKLLVEAINTHKSYATAYKNLNRIYTSIASEAYRRALSESNEPVEYAYNIKLTALRELDFTEQSPVKGAPPLQDSLIQIANIKTLLIERVKNWARAWSNKDMLSYTGYYSSEYHQNFATHSAWVENRRRRIKRPGPIKVKVSKIQVRHQSKNLALIDFEQTFQSSNYGDRVIKRLSFSLIDSEWKIFNEQVLSVL